MRPKVARQRRLGSFKKNLKLDRLTQSACKAVKIGHTVKINMIIGFPHETLRDVLSSILYGVRMAWHGVEDCNLAVFTPYPGSELYKDLRAADTIPAPSDDYFRNLLVQFDLTKATSHTPHVSGWALAFWRVIGLACFYLTAYLCHPQRLVRLFNSIVRAGKFEPNNVIEQRVFDLIVRMKLARHNRLSIAEGPR